jgi:hypothetical protein
MKICIRCKKEKSLKEFNFKNKALGITQKSCKKCTRLEVRNHYYNNKQYYLDKARKRNSKNRDIVKKYIWEFLLIHPCIDCGEKNPVVLDFDHQGNKISNISDIIKNRNSLKMTQREIRKCVVRCANCHRKKTARDFGWNKHKLSL